MVRLLTEYICSRCCFISGTRSKDSGGIRVIWSDPNPGSEKSRFGSRFVVEEAQIRIKFRSMKKHEIRWDMGIIVGSGSGPDALIQNIKKKMKKSNIRNISTLFIRSDRNPVSVPDTDPANVLIGKPQKSIFFKVAQPLRGRGGGG